MKTKIILALVLLTGCVVQQPASVKLPPFPTVAIARAKAAAVSAPAVAAPSIIPAGASVNLGWTVPNDPNVGGTYLHVGTNSGIYFSKINVGNVTNATINGLAVGMRYYFGCNLYSTWGEESPYYAETNAVAVNEIVTKVPAYTNSASGLEDWQFSHYIFTGTNVQGSGFWRLMSPVQTVNTHWQ